MQAATGAASQSAASSTSAAASQRGVWGDAGGAHCASQPGNQQRLARDGFAHAYPEFINYDGACGDERWQAARAPQLQQGTNSEVRYELNLEGVKMYSSLVEAMIDYNYRDLCGEDLVNAYAADNDDGEVYQMSRKKMYHIFEALLPIIAAKRAALMQEVGARTVQFQHLLTGVVVAETDVTPQEYNLSVGYFMRKVLLNPYLFSVVHNRDEIDPEVLTSKNDFIPGSQAVAYDENPIVYHLVNRDDRVEVQWFGASMNFREGRKFRCVRLPQLPVVRVDADNPRVSDALTALLEQMRQQDLQELPLFTAIQDITGVHRITRRRLDEGRHYVRGENIWIIRCVLFSDNVGLSLRLKLDDRFQVSENLELQDQIWEFLSLTAAA